VLKRVEHQLRRVFSKRVARVGDIRTGLLGGSPRYKSLA
jgi:hypothetical protein